MTQHQGRGPTYYGFFYCIVSPSPPPPYSPGTQTLLTWVTNYGSNFFCRFRDPNSPLSSFFNPTFCLPVTQLSNLTFCLAVTRLPRGPNTLIWGVPAGVGFSSGTLAHPLPQLTHPRRSLLRASGLPKLRDSPLRPHLHVASPRHPRCAASHYSELTAIWWVGLFLVPGPWLRRSNVPLTNASPVHVQQKARFISGQLQTRACLH
jgi:hypothetical protein